ncbi:MAG: glutamate synthase large subunit [Cyanobacteria bacterium SID2]|nr:glutamate synthase large subunit [Cyanobacteria bacterium SID2]MBP0006585.1 glutamate synthase large subunit [Cyanobacteria bacterium SBC]
MDRTGVNRDAKQYRIETHFPGNPTPPDQSAPRDGQRWLVEERDACGVGFIAAQNGQANHDIVEKAVSALSCLEHRGGCSADYDSGDGSGILMSVPWALVERWLEERGTAAPVRERTAVGMVFLPQDEATADLARKVVNNVLAEEGFEVLGWRVVPVAPEVLGPQARELQPQIEQVIVRHSTLEGDELERATFLARRSIGKVLDTHREIDWGDNFYICSLSSRTIVYKAMVRAEVLGNFYLDLNNPETVSCFAVYHRRFSTNTMPRWPLAQPMRLLGHNGEINTLLGNINWMKARGAELASPVWGDRISTLLPVVDASNSDSANLDNVMELLVRSGRTPLEALMLMVPEAYRNQPALENYPEVVDFYEYYSGLQEAWDGPALLAFSDGKIVGAGLDRNGLRPARYVLTRDGLAIVSSEAGTIEIDPADILETGRLGPGQTFAVDLENHRVLKNWDIKRQVAAQNPYGTWIAARPVLGSRDAKPFEVEASQLVQQQTCFGYTKEDVDMIVVPMATDGKEPTYCMGDDIPLAVLSDKPRLLYDYFKQRFAQVTNPAIDPLREGLVMSLNMMLGRRSNLLNAQPGVDRLLKIDSPILTEGEFAGLQNSALNTVTLSTLFSIDAGAEGLRLAVERLCQKAVEAVESGAEVLILSDRSDESGNAASISEHLTYIPPMLAVGAVHHHLIERGLRMRASIVADTAQCWSTHHYACLVGYGASAVCPYLTWETLQQWWHDDRTQKLFKAGKLPEMSCDDAFNNYRKAAGAGLLKILSKMGISLLASYQGAQIFEAIGIGADLLDLGMKGTTSRIGGLTVDDLGRETLAFHKRAFPHVAKLENYGFIQHRKGGEYHGNNPDMTKVLHKAVRDGQYDHYDVYKKQLEDRPVAALRDLLDFKSDRSPIALEDVESIEDILKRFCTGGMSLGALSPEAHETLAIAMNRIGGKSNSGEGGEDPIRFKALDDVDENGFSKRLPHLKGLKNGDTASSAIKQVASGRFGVTPEYLMSAKQIEIKVAQGAKPGEGGQLPGRKVSNYIAMLRRSKPGVTLISPPPHHDIYSIEDLAQLIFDLHQINPNAGVSVKLVASVGIGTIAAGVAKANADVIQISGHDGGTGASPLSSIKHAGSPWELGLTEVHRVLMENRLRERVVLRVDGGMRTGWDVLMAALMGAQEFGFGTIAMIAEGCIMARVCHMNRCPVGVTTQQENLRKRFPGMPEHVVNFFVFVAEEVRSLLARLGYRSLDELIGRSDLLKVRDNVNLTKPQSIDLRCLLDLPQTESRAWVTPQPVHSNGPVLDDKLLADAEIAAAIGNQGSVRKTVKVVNTDRCVGARVSGSIAKKYGNTGFEGQLELNFVGSAGQSFGAFNLPGMLLTLEGEANDYVGKGMHGGEIRLIPPSTAIFDPSENVILGNTCLYGATGGILFAQGRAGERFAVRNSKGQAVIEGAGDHCCEYMTGGVVVVLGPVGRNVGAGMTGGLAYFFDEDGSFPAKVNPEIVKMQRVCSPAGEEQLKTLVQAHADRGSAKAKRILESWSEYLPQFWQVVPPSEAETPQANPEAIEAKELAKA